MEFLAFYGLFLVVYLVKFVPHKQAGTALEPDDSLPPVSKPPKTKRPVRSDSFSWSGIELE